MHACGHDMHTACLLGALLVLNRHKSEIAGTVFGLFQPGEEVCPGGASMVMAEDPFRDYRVVAFVGEHVAPEMAVGNLGFRSGKYMASSDELWIEVHGTGGHGALPHTMTDPVVAAAALITSLQQVVSRHDPDRAVDRAGHRQRSDQRHSAGRTSRRDAAHDGRTVARAG